MNIIDLPSIGDALEGGFYGGIIRMREALYAVIWAPKASGETEGSWLPKAAAVPGATSCFDSMANTVAMAEAGSAIGNWARGLSIGGHTDWCIPARDVLELGYCNLKPSTGANYCSFRDGDNASSHPVGYPYTEQSPPQTAAEPFRIGGAEAFAEAWYWASTQYSDHYAWLQYFTSGLQGIDGKSFEARVRAVRLIQLTA